MVSSTARLAMLFDRERDECIAKFRKAGEIYANIGKRNEWNEAVISIVDGNIPSGVEVFDPKPCEKEFGVAIKIAKTAGRHSKNTYYASSAEQEKIAANKMVNAFRKYQYSLLSNTNWNNWNDAQDSLDRISNALGYTKLGTSFKSVLDKRAQELKDDANEIREKQFEVTRRYGANKKSAPKESKEGSFFRKR